eukprot:COSAG05_NODE_509_length_9130_cov_3.978740_6_plen_40_part_00
MVLNSAIGEDRTDLLVLAIQSEGRASILYGIVIANLFGT